MLNLGPQNLGSMRGLGSRAATDTLLTAENKIATELYRGMLQE